MSKIDVDIQIAKLKKIMLQEGYKHASIENYCGSTKLFLQSVSSDYRRPDLIPVAVIKKFLDKIKVPNTQKIYALGIKYFYNRVLNQPKKFVAIKYKSPPKKTIKYLRVHDVQTLFDTCRNDKQRICLAIMYSCGIRPGELINIKLNQLNLTKMSLSISDKRTIQLPPSIKLLLERYIRIYKPKEWLLNGRLNGKYSGRSLQHMIVLLSKNSGIKTKVTPELLRQTSFIHMFNEGIDLKVLQLYAGHKSMSSTRKIVTNHSRRDVPSALNKIDLHR